MAALCRGPRRGGRAQSWRWLRPGPVGAAVLVKHTPASKVVLTSPMRPTPNGCRIRSPAARAIYFASMRWDDDPDRRGAEQLLLMLTDREGRSAVAIATDPPVLAGRRPLLAHGSGPAIIDRLAPGGQIIEIGTKSYH
jgi:hypothetical protein